MRLMIAYVMVVVVAVALLAGCQMQGLQGRREQVVLQAVPDTAHPWPKSAAAQRKMMEDARRVVRQRAMGLRGVSDVDVSLQGKDRLVVAFRSAGSSVRMPHSLLSTAQLEFYWLKDVQGSNNPSGRWLMDIPTDTYRFTGPKGVVIDSLSDPKAVLEQVVGVPKNKPVLTGKDLLPNARANLNSRNQVVVNLQFNERGTRVFREFTRAHVGDYLAVFFDGKLLTVPVINEAIPGGQAEITGFKTLAEARQTADMLNSGTLPVRLRAVGK